MSPLVYRVAVSKAVPEMSISLLVLLVVAGAVI